MGKLEGSIVGSNKYASITGVKISSVILQEDAQGVQGAYGGLFTSLGEKAYIENLSFEGGFDFTNLTTTIDGVPVDEIYLGLVAGKIESGARLTNVSVNLQGSSIEVAGTNQNKKIYIGGVVGYNSGDIVQDFSSSSVAGETKQDGKLYSYTIYMHGTLDIKYTQITTYTGGIAGYSDGLIKKIDGQTFTGYTNYMAYSLINLKGNGASYLGAGVGYVSVDSQTKGILGYIDSNIVYGQSGDYVYSAGKGVVVGGEVCGDGYVGGVVGYFENKLNDGIESYNFFAGVTTRTFVRSTSTNAGYITGEISTNALMPIFYIQAIDDKRAGDDASMLVFNVDSSSVNIDLEDYNKLALGQNCNLTTFGDENGYYAEYFVSYLRRTQTQIDQNAQIVESQDGYYGEAVVISENDQTKTCLQQKFFETKGQTTDLAINGNFTVKNGEEVEVVNEMTATNSSTKAFYAFYFNAVSAQSENDSPNLSLVQENLNTYFNTQTSSGKFYPINVTGEMTLTSLNSNILDIDQTGQITIKGTGWVQISGSSILNSNDGISFYIFVTNFFNYDKSISIIYPNTSQSATALDNATISMFANDTVVLYVRPNYQQSVSIGDNILNVNANGSAILNGFAFNMATNRDISADIEITKAVDGNDNDGNDNDGNDNGENGNNEFSTSSSGQTIIITKKQSSTTTDNYSTIITPKISGTVGGVKYSAKVNKELTGVKIDYSKGALAIGTGVFDGVTISTSNSLNDRIYIRSTAEKDDEGVDYYVTFNGERITTEDEDLFTVSFGSPSPTSDTGTIKEYYIPYTISVNRDSESYKNRFNEDIYGQYVFTFVSQTNSAIYCNLTLNLENQALQSIVIDNYINQKNMTTSIGNSTLYAYPGSNGLLAVTLSPDDSDFDYLVIENADENSNNGNGVARFSLAGRLNSPGENENLFEANTILGSATSQGLVLTKDQLLELHRIKDSSGNLKYQNYTGIVYFIYNIGNSGVVENGTSRFIVNIYKDNQLKSEDISLTLRLQNFVSVSIEGKTPEVDGEYLVARGLRYKLVIDSFGFNDDNISTPKVTDGNEYASIVQENGEYYVQITSGDIGTREVKVAISVEAVRYDDERKVSADDTINLNVMQFVINSAVNDISLEDNNFGSLDIITNMSGGVVTVSIGSTRTIEVDIYDYIEYDTTNQAVINAVNGFVRSLTTQGDWKYWTNIAPGQSVPAIGAGEASYPDVFPENELVETYYFDAEFDTRNNVGVTIRPRRINEAEADLYYFTYSIRYQRYENSYAILTSSSEGYSTAAKISTKIRFEVFVSSSMETPIPIFDYEDFLDMHEGGYYILLNDITLPSSSINSGALETVEQFTPITANFASLDGNGHSIIWDGVYDFGASGQLGVFSSLSSGSIISNLNIVVRSSYDTGNATYGTIFNTTNAEHRTGLLVGVNNGIITNCKVYSPSNTIFTINCALANIESAYFGSIAGENNGYITNCTSSINVYGSFNIAGIAGINNGTIGASAYKEGTLVSSDNQIDEGFHVAGLVNVNSTSGKIVTSYVTGGITENSLYTTSTSSYLSGPNFSAGFVYENAGEISDCYSDIYLANSGNMAGFVYVNTGSVKNSFSLSILQNNTIASAGFAMRNVSFDEEQESVGDNQENVGDNSGIGTFENCYYLSHLHTTNCPAGCQYGKNINIDLNTVSFDGVSGIDNFDVTNAENEYFDSYAYTNYISTIGVWFYTGDETISTQYIEFEPTDMHTTVSSEDDTFGTQVNTNYEIVSKSLPKGRLELSAPNIDALSIRNFSYADVDTETGNITYRYVYDMATEATRRASDGSIYNPYIIYDAQSMEIEMTEQTNSITGQNSGNYRLVSDIDYTNYEDNSNLYNTIFIGNFEGNGMEINYIVLQSNAQMEYAGLFAGLGVSSSKQGVIKNLVLTPSVVNFAGAVSVGALVGYVNHGHIYNVDVTTDNNLIVQGGNFVGGVVGRASGSYVFKNITSNVNAIANYTPVESDRQNIYTENQNASVFSYAGGLFGHLGTGSVENVEYTADQTIRANFAGLAFGGLGQGANVSVVKVTNNDSNIINAYTYGGLIAGEISGSLTESVVYNSGSRITPFSIVGQTPIAVGGIAGVLSGGNITKAVMRQSFTVTEKLSASNTYSTIQNVGGLVGMVRANASQMSYISQVVVEADITAVQNLGGAVGNVASPATIDQVAVKPETTQSALRLESNMTTSLYLGGIIGRLGDLLNRPQLVLTNSYCLSDLTIVASRANSQPQVYVGGLLGSGTQNLTINNCYTASYINARLVNMMNMWDDSQAYFNGITDREAPVSFYLQTSSNDNIQNTYYYGANGGASLSIVENFVSVMANFELSGGAISINNYGKSSYDYSGSDTSLNPIYNVIFDDDINAGIWTGSNSGGNSNSTFRTLVFENDLYWI